MGKGINPPDYFLTFAVSEAALHLFFPVISVFSAPFSYSGIFLIVTGIFLNLWADMLFRRNNTTVKPGEKPTVLVTGGPFRVSRHPMYLGMFMMLVGEALVLGSLSAFIFPAAFFIVMNVFFIPKEENSLRKAFGNRYENYSRKTGKWL